MGSHELFPSACFYGIINAIVTQQIMIPKKRGRPATGTGEPVMVRLQPKQLAKLDAWIRRQADAPTRPEAIRRLLERALKR